MTARIPVSNGFSIENGCNDPNTSVGRGVGGTAAGLLLLVFPAEWVNENDEECTSGDWSGPVLFPAATPYYWRGRAALGVARPEWHKRVHHVPRSF